VNELSKLQKAWLIFAHELGHNFGGAWTPGCPQDIPTEILPKSTEANCQGALSRMATTKVPYGDVDHDSSQDIA
jgi:hypothetical protein